MEKKFVRVGVGVMILRDSKVLLGKRKGSHGAGEWSFPGGHLEFNESLEDCAKREVAEETGIKIKNIRKLCFTNDIFKKEGRHYITCFLRADFKTGKVKLLEPDKCEEWDWFNLNKLPKPIFLPIRNLVKECLNGKNKPGI
jgi:8-oxo-dGTP diphosphatase